MADAAQAGEGDARPGRAKLKGVVEADETYVGGAEVEDEEGPAKPGRGSRKNMKVVVAVEGFPSQRGVPVFGTTRIRIVRDVKAETLLDFSTDVIEPGLGTHQGSAQKWHLDYDLDEFSFRFNRPGSRKRGLPFYRRLEGAVATPPLPYGAVHARGAVERATRRARKAALAA